LQNQYVFIKGVLNLHVFRFTVFRRSRSLLIPSQKVDLVFERLSLLDKLGDHPILARRKWATSPVACLNDFAHQSEQRSTLPLFVGD
jgi:hypothetical protein